MKIRSKALVVSISGCSSSGKTTIARLLRDIFPSAFILHEDDFYKPETEMPFKNGVLDWDCAEAINVQAMADALAYIRTHAAFPPTLESKEDQNGVSACPIDAAAVDALKRRVNLALGGQTSCPHPLLRGSLRLCLLEGFLLFAPSMAALIPNLDLKLFVRATRATVKARREGRSGYVTIEGFWADPPGYIDSIVWSNYVADHAWMFENGDVEGRYDHATLAASGVRALIEAPPDADMELMLNWAVDSILDQLRLYS